VIGRLNAEANKALGTDAMKQKLMETAARRSGGTPQQFAAVHPHRAREVGRRGARGGIKLD
jgi:general stress protein YciG